MLCAFPELLSNKRVGEVLIKKNFLQRRHTKSCFVISKRMFSNRVEVGFARKTEPVSGLTLLWNRFKPVFGFYIQEKTNGSKYQNILSKLWCSKFEKEQFVFMQCLL